MSLPEVLLWRELRARPGGHKFRKQHAAGPHALDFYCASAGLCIEVDGKAHDMGTSPQRDEHRDAWLAEQGIKTIRIPAEEILRDIEPVILLIQQECASRSSSTMNRCAVPPHCAAMSGVYRPGTWRPVHSPVPLPRKAGGGFRRAHRRAEAKNIR
jgi:very-short-patch-repair endonuclease